MATTSEIEHVLREHAVNGTTDLDHAWEIRSNDHGVRFVGAATSETYPTPAEACVAGVALADRLTSPLGFVLQGYCVIGAAQVCGPSANQPGWRGHVKIALREDTVAFIT
jgi:hypothetical protein